MRNIEIKASANEKQHARVRDWMRASGAEYRGTDKQTDTYFNVGTGRLKLREGNIENCLIQYNRPDHAAPKQSNYTLVPVEAGSALKTALEKSLGVLAVVEKVRDIFYVANIKIHLDSVVGLGLFIEIEARDEEESIPLETLHEQCKRLSSHFGILDGDLITNSYSDMLLSK